MRCVPVFESHLKLDIDEVSGHPKLKFTCASVLIIILSGSTPTNFDEEMQTEIKPLLVSAITARCRTLLPRSPGLMRQPHLSYQRGPMYAALMVRLSQVTEFMYTGQRFRTPVLAHDLYGHCTAGVTELLCRANHLNGTRECADCNSIPVKQRVKLVEEDITWRTRYPFMQTVGVCLLRSRKRELAGHVQVVIVEYSTSCLFHKVVRPGERVGVEIVRLLTWLHDQTGLHPRELVFTGQQGIRMNEPTDPVRQHLEQHSIEFTPVAPLVRVPFAGHARLFDVIDGHYRAICRQHGVRWVNTNSYLIDVLNRTPDFDHLTPAMRFFQHADARAALFYMEKYRFQLNGQIIQGYFVGYSKDGLSYRMLTEGGDIFKTERVDPHPVPITPPIRSPVRPTPLIDAPIAQAPSPSVPEPVPSTSSAPDPTSFGQSESDQAVLALFERRQSLDARISDLLGEKQPTAEDTPLEPLPQLMEVAAPRRTINIDQYRRLRATEGGPTGEAWSAVVERIEARERGEAANDQDMPLEEDDAIMFEEEDDEPEASAISTIDRDPSPAEQPAVEQALRGREGSGPSEVPADAASDQSSVQDDANTPS